MTAYEPTEEQKQHMEGLNKGLKDLFIKYKATGIVSVAVPWGDLDEKGERLHLHLSVRKLTEPYTLGCVEQVISDARDHAKNMFMEASAPKMDVHAIQVTKEQGEKLMDILKDALGKMKADDKPPETPQATA